MVDMMKRTLSSIGAQRAAQAKLVEDLEAPRRKLAELADMERELLARKQVLDDKKAALENDLMVATEFLDFWEPRESKLKDTVETLTTLEDSGIGRWSGVLTFNRSQLNLITVGVREMLISLSDFRERRTQLQGEIKLLAREIRTLEG